MYRTYNCTRHVEDEFPQPRGERKAPIIKYFMGGALLILIIAIIWFPLVFFSLGNAVGKPNPPYDVTLEIRIGPYEPVYTMSAQSNSIDQFSESNLHKLEQAYVQQKAAATFISNYEAADIAAVTLGSNSANIWSISPPDRSRMLNEVNSTDPLKIRLEYKVSHKTSKPEDSGVIPDYVEISVPATIDGKINEMRQNLLQMLQGNKLASPMVLENILPKFLKVTNKGTAKALNQLMFVNKRDTEKSTPKGKSFRTITLELHSSSDSDKEWWIIKEVCDDFSFKYFLHKIPFVDCNSIILYTFNDKIFPSTLSILTGGGIIGLYSTLVFVAFRFLRGFFAEQCFKIMFEDMPNIDRVLQLCLDIYLVREAGEFVLEEDLFAKLIFLFRSPETMIKWTRPKEELADDEDPEGDDA